MRLLYLSKNSKWYRSMILIIIFLKNMRTLRSDCFLCLNTAICISIDLDELLKSFKEKYNNYSNFTKINNNYVTYVFKQIAFLYRSGLSKEDHEILDSILYVASEEDINREYVFAK